MTQNMFRRLRMLELEEQMLNGGAIIAIIGVFMPWSGGHMLGSDAITYTGLGFYTSFLGLAVLLLNVFMILITAIPLTGGPTLVRKKHKEVVRLLCALQSSILVLAALSVLTKVAFEFSRMEIRFGIYVTLIGSLIALLYAFLKFQEKRKSEVQELFHHPEEEIKKEQHAHQSYRPVFSPPPAPKPEEHHTLM